MEKTDEKIMLYIPLGINTRMDFFTGFGKKELAQAMVGIFLGSLVAIFGFILTQQTLTVVIIMIVTISGSIMVTTKNSINQSIVDYLNDMIKFSKERKTYPYRQVKEWE